MGVIWIVLLARRSHEPDASEGKRPEQTIKLLRVVGDLQATGSQLLAELEDIIQVPHEQYNVRRQRVIDWVTKGYAELAQVDVVAAERFGEPREAEALDTYPHVTRGNIALRPLIGLIEERLNRLADLRSRN